MSVAELRRRVKKRLDDLPGRKLLAVAEYVDSLDRRTAPENRAKIERMKSWLRKAEREFAGGKGVNWRRVRQDV